MKKQEAIEEINNLPVNACYERPLIDKKDVIEIINQIDEPEKPVIPQFVADWIEKNKSYINTLYNAYTLLGQRKNDVSLWVNSNQDTFARAWLFGYEVEKEKLYTVEIPNHNDPNFKYTILGKDLDGEVFLTKVDGEDWKYNHHYQLTESEIKKDFDWAWQAGFAKEVEYENSKTHT